MDGWADGDRYERFMGRWSRLVAPEVLASLAVPGGLRWVDVGCGTGAVTEAVLFACDPVSVLGVDPTEPFVEHCTRHVRDPRASFRTGTAQSLPCADASADVVVSGLALNFTPDPVAALAEAARVVVPGGTVAAYVWDYPEGMELLRTFWDAAVSVDPAASALHEGTRFGFCRPGPLQGFLDSAGLADGEVEGVTVATPFPDAEAYWAHFQSGGAPAPTYVRSLSDERRAAVREAVVARLPVAADGSVPMRARAWVLRGRRAA